MIKETSPTAIKKDQGTLILLVRGKIVMQRCYKGTKMKEQLKESWYMMWGLKNHPSAVFKVE